MNLTPSTHAEQMLAGLRANRPSSVQQCQTVYTGTWPEPATRCPNTATRTEGRFHVCDHHATWQCQHPADEPCRPALTTVTDLIAQA
jgi:hypothetical protein